MGHPTIPSKSLYHASIHLSNSFSGRTPISSHSNAKQTQSVSVNQNLSNSQKKMEISASSLLLPTLPRTPHRASLSSCKSLFFNNGRKEFLLKKSNTMVLTRKRAQTGLDCRCLFGLGVPELVVIAGVAALLFGPKKLPEIGRSIGKAIKGFQQVLSLSSVDWICP